MEDSDLSIKTFIEDVAAMAAIRCIELTGLEFSKKSFDDYNQEFKSHQKIVLNTEQSDKVKQQNVSFQIIRILCEKSDL